MEQVLHLGEISHPNKQADKNFQVLFGIDSIKQELLRSLLLMLDSQRLERWIKQYHPGTENFLKDLIGNQKLAILAGEVGCGKTMLANSIGTPLANKLDKKVLCLESPTNIRGQGMVGELSARITSLFDQAKSKVSNGKCGLLIIDEADDLATSRSQMQAHHEDRAGVNVLARQIDSLSKEQINLAVILISNRLSALDPAILRRSATTLIFERPNAEIRKNLFINLFKKLNFQESDTEISNLVEITERDSLRFTYSDILKRGLKTALVTAVEHEKPLTPSLLQDVFSKMYPTPMLETHD
jgi:SpoVK/Ycf46/Vps4 family AAA+-type ATPase